MTLTSQFYGLRFDTRKGRWRVALRAGEKNYWVAYFQDELSAAISRDRKIREQGLLDTLNFPDVP